MQFKRTEQKDCDICVEWRLTDRSSSETQSEHKFLDLIFIPNLEAVLFVWHFLNDLLKTFRPIWKHRSNFQASKPFLSCLCVLKSFVPRFRWVLWYQGDNSANLSNGNAQRTAAPNTKRLPFAQQTFVPTCQVREQISFCAVRGSKRNWAIFLPHEKYMWTSPRESFDRPGGVDREYRCTLSWWWISQIACLFHTSFPWIPRTRGICKRKQTGPSFPWGDSCNFRWQHLKPDSDKKAAYFLFWMSFSMSCFGMNTYSSPSTSAGFFGREVPGIIERESSYRGANFQTVNITVHKTTKAELSENQNRLHFWNRRTWLQTSDFVSHTATCMVTENLLFPQAYSTAMRPHCCCRVWHCVAYYFGRQE